MFKRLLIPFIVGGTFLCTACGTPQPTSAPPTKVNTTGDQPLQLKTFTDATNVNIAVQAPSGWTKSTVSGGDYSGWKFTNPKNQSEYEIVVRSTCVGCYMGSDGKSDASLVIPKDAKNAKTLTKSAHDVTYQFDASDSSYQGQGHLITSQNKSGYAYVETVFAPNHVKTSTSILNQFKLNS